MSTFDAETSTRLAKTLSSLHIPGTPILFTNIWDPPSTTLALSFSATKAIATTSSAIAICIGLEDDDLTLTENLAAVSLIRNTLIKTNKAYSIPLSVDFQDGYGSQLVEGIEKLVDLGVVGVNIEDALRDPNVPGSAGKLIPATEQAERIKLVMETAKRKGVEGFVVNARTDVVVLGGTVEEAVERGKVYLEAGATTVFVWDHVRGLRDEDVRVCVRGLGGKVAVIHRSQPGFLSVKEIAGLGVARVSIGGGLLKAGQAALAEEMRKVIEGC